jgi:hypothetical protein
LFNLFSVDPHSFSWTELKDSRKNIQQGVSQLARPAHQKWDSRSRFSV